MATSPSATPTPITPPRVPIIDPRTGLIDRAWYQFFLSLFRASETALDSQDLGPPVQDLSGDFSNLYDQAQLASMMARYDDCCRVLEQRLDTLPSDQAEGLQAQIDSVRQEVQTLPNDALQPQIAELQKQIEALQVQPIVDAGAISAAIAALSSAPVTYTANFSVANGETWLINNKSGSSCTATLPTASTSTGRTLHFQNYQAQTLVSASSNVVPLAGGAATTAILEAVAGANATLVSDGTNWIMTQYDSNNALQLE